ncbi:ABC transporter ATP-binding protein [Roseiarcaceae bacterium H3SJ34-1]|uniref:ABC transporter ATP-binding protein n=1 Tax=Terripilifer ovatus TaxID=3032367 RepID=UPI003AB9A5BA|nr:ABC transporter ATP-binding protein [Roseiarcaceae bacterium H3SJ34-1]
MAPLLDVRDLTTHFFTQKGAFAAVDKVSFSVNAGETMALVGESGCGKSVTAASILRLVPDPPGRITGGEIIFEGRDLLSLTMREMRKVRGGRIGMIFQEPMTSLNPVFTIGDQITESLREHRSISRADAERRAIELLDLVRIPDARRQIHNYPHRLSGGMRQRAMIAMALACDPALLIADEPTTALDVTTQAQILELLDELKRSLGMAILLITHDLGVVAEYAQSVLVMYAGRGVEAAKVEDLFHSPIHPYTRGLLGALPHPDDDVDSEGRPLPLNEISGMVPALDAMPAGCRFEPRCSYAVPACKMTDVRLAPLAEGVRSAACLRAADIVQDQP